MSVWPEIEQHKIDHYRNQRITREREARDSALQRFASHYTRSELVQQIDFLKLQLTVTRWVSAISVIVMGYALFVALHGGGA